MNAAPKRGYSERGAHRQTNSETPCTSAPSDLNGLKPKRLCRSNCGNSSRPLAQHRGQPTCLHLPAGDCSQSGDWWKGSKTTDYCKQGRHAQGSHFETCLNCSSARFDVGSFVGLKWILYYIYLDIFACLCRMHTNIFQLQFGPSVPWAVTERSRLNQSVCAVGTGLLSTRMVLGLITSHVSLLQSLPADSPQQHSADTYF